MSEFANLLITQYLCRVIIKKMKVRILLIYLCLVCSWVCSAQKSATEYYFKRISIEQGLSQSGVTAILRDYQGTLWIGTRQGINRVDRNHIQKYTDLYIFHLIEDKQHQLWAVTDKGVWCYNSSEDIFQPKIDTPLFAICATDSGVYFGGYGAIFEYSYSHKHIRRLPLQKASYAKSRECLINHLLPFDAHTLLVGTEADGIYLYDFQTQQLRPFITENTRPLTALYYDAQKHQIYYASFQKGLYCYQLTTQQTSHYSTANSALPNDIILDIKPYKGQIWIATDGGGVSVFSPDKVQFENLQHRAGDAHSLPVNSITTLYEDPNHNLWAGTVRDGVFLFKETYIKTYTDSALGANNGLSERAVISLYEAPDHTLWIGTDGGGINAFNPHTEQFTHHLNTYNDKVSSITLFSPNELLVSLYGKGLFIYNTHTRSYTPFILRDPTTDQQECHSGFTPFVYRINDAQILITAKNTYRYQLKSQQFEQVAFAQGTAAKNALQLQAIQGDTLLLSKGNTLYKISGKGGTISTYLTLPTEGAITALCYDTHQRLWIATTNGLFNYTPTTGKLSAISTDNMFRQISYMQIDDAQRLWINASNVLFSYYIPSKKILIYDASDGFLANDMLTGYVQASTTPYIYMGGVGGLVKINHNIQSYQSAPPQIFLHNIELNGKIYTHENFPKEIPPYFHSLKINVGLNEKDMFRRILFRFKIKNNAQTSVIETYDNQLDISLLSVGKYQVSVACMTKNGFWTAETPLLDFEVLPVWYKRTSFLIAVVLLVVAIAGGAIWIYLRRKKQQLKWQIALHQQALNEDKIQFLTNVSHELRTPLTLIYAPLKRLLSNTEEKAISPAAKSLLESAFRQANAMKNIINWILDYNRNTTLENSLSKTHTDLNHLLTDCSNDFAQELESKHIGLQLCLDKNLPIIPLDPAKIRVVISNLLMNALKFSNEHSTIYLRSFANADSVRFQVENTGISLQNIDTEKLFIRFQQGKHEQKGSGIGLAYCKELVAMHSGTIGAYDENGHTVFYVTLPYTPSAILDKFEGEASQSQAPTHNLSSMDTTGYSILLVDDNTDFLNYLHSELRPLFRNVLKAVNGEEALLLLKTHQPDLIISDVMMPVMNGYQFCQQVKEQLPISHIPVVLLTAKSDSESQKIGYKLGADAYLSKPFDIDLLLSVINNLLKQRELIRQRYQQELPLPAPTITTISNADEVFLVKLNEVIKNNYSKADFEVANIADKMAMSRATIYSKMKEITGLGISEYVNKYRIEVASALLRNTDKTIAEIALEVGFNSQKYFSTAFKAAIGKTPSEYRNA